MYYVGKKSQCEYYDNKVSNAEKYVDGDNWANYIKHHSEEKYAILKHDKYTHSSMQLVKELPEEFTPSEI